MKQNTSPGLHHLDKQTTQQQQQQKGVKKKNTEQNKQTKPPNKTTHTNNNKTKQRYAPWLPLSRRQDETPPAPPATETCACPLAAGMRQRWQQVPAPPQLLTCSGAGGHPAGDPFHVKWAPAAGQRPTLCTKSQTWGLPCLYYLLMWVQQEVSTPTRAPRDIDFGVCPVGAKPNRGECAKWERDEVFQVASERATIAEGALKAQLLQELQADNLPAEQCCCC